ncbi:hypothetical protein V5N11_026060 [Cardamine amara subsp. amara]|uniref:Uncharacterized protein n=1 Tax=Cardamine amara subsp. amara TaxID=228776 RepID=A0ABD1C804_CARAN
MRNKKSKRVCSSLPTDVPVKKSAGDVSVSLAKDKTQTPSDSDSAATKDSPKAASESKTPSSGSTPSAKVTVTIPIVALNPPRGSDPAQVGKSTKATHVADLDPASRTTNSKNDSWASLFKGSSRRLCKKGTAFTLPSGEACVKIPNSVIEKNKKVWDCFILGQFYSDPSRSGNNSCYCEWYME